MAFNYEIELRLRNWAKWVVIIAEGTMGFPSESLISCFSKYGFIPTSQLKSSVPLINSPKEEEINTMINRMAMQFPHYSTALYKYYIGKGKQADIAKDMGISTRTLRARVRDAKLWIHGKIYS